MPLEQVLSCHSLIRYPNHLSKKKSQGLYRHRRIVSSPQGAEIVVDGQFVLSFCSNDYLGLANHPDVITALQEGATTYGVGSGASHLVTGHSSAHHELENALAKWTGVSEFCYFHQAIWRTLA